jgi:3-phenylpropionate/cinnamic acid dioxygenase small subunit
VTGRDDWFSACQSLADVPDPTDRQLILEVLYRYAIALDSGDVNGWVSCFSPDAAYSVWRRGCTSAMFDVRGLDALRTYRVTHPVIEAGAAWQHQVCNTRMLSEADRDFVRSHSYWTSIVADPTPRLLAFGAYYDRLQRQADRTWLLLERRTESHATSAAT